MTRTSIALLILASLTVGAAAQAQSVVSPVGAGNSGNIASHKQQELVKIQQKMQILQTLQSCVNGAASTDAIRSCNETAKAARGSSGKKC